LDTKEIYKAIFDTGPDATLVVDEDGNIVMVNELAEKLFGYTCTELVGKKIELLLPERYRKGHVADRKGYNQNPERRQMGANRDISGRKKDGSEFFAEVTISPICLQEKMLIVSSVRDVTERKEKDNKLLQNEQQFRHTLDNLLELVVILDHEMRYVYINNAGVEQTRFSREQILGRRITEVFPGFENTEIYSIYRECLDNKVSRHLETEFTFPDGSTGWFEISIQPIPEGIFVLSIDRTPKKQAKLQLIAQKKFFEAILNNIPADIAVFDKDHNYVFINPIAIKNQEMREWLIGKNDFDYVKLKGLDTAIAQIRRDRFNSVVARKQSVEWIDEYPTPEGTKYVLRKLHPFVEDEEIRYVIGYGIDVTESKQSELKLQALYADLKSANKELEQFSYMVSHDLQEPLRMVTGFLNLLKLETQDVLTADAKEYIDFASDGAERMKEMIKDLLQYSRVGTSKEDFTEVDLDEVMTYVKHVLKERTEETGAVVKVAPLGKVRGIETLLNQLFMNLLSNALKYHSEKPPEIEVGCKEEGDHLLFYVKDNGIGIHPRFFDKIFGIFHRLHARNEYSGTGLGLAISKKIVEKHGGNIWLESIPGEGSTFYFTLLKNIP
jgi:PAS domain S-box-containing protein